jgi:tRNA pseudouridine55 synthase
MPKVSGDVLPVSGLFAVAKPSGPTSMKVVEDIKRLIAGSRLFLSAEKLAERENAKGKRKHRNREGVKIGQGGTLDPLADGVLGESMQSRFQKDTSNLIT